MLRGRERAWMHARTHARARARARSHTHLLRSLTRCMTPSYLHTLDTTFPIFLRENAHLGFSGAATMDRKGPEKGHSEFR